MYQSDALEFVVNQSIWFEGEAKFADVILPALHEFRARRYLGVGGTWRLRPITASSSSIIRVILFQAPAIKPLGEIQVRLLDLQRNLQGGSALPTTSRKASTRIDWVKRLYEASDMPKVMSWKKFIKRGYYVVAGREGEIARAGILPLVLREPKKGRAGGAAAAVGLCGRISQRAADPVRQARVRMQQPQAFSTIPSGRRS